MKKYLMTGIAAVAMCAAFTSCSHDFGFEQMTQEEAIQSKYEAAFIKAFGQPSPDQDWGFGTNITRAANTNGNQWHDPTYYNLKYDAKVTTAEKNLVFNYVNNSTQVETVNQISFTNYWVTQIWEGDVDKNADNVMAPVSHSYPDQNGNITNIIGGAQMDKLMIKESSDGGWIHCNNFNNANNENYKEGGEGGRTLMLSSGTYSFGYTNSQASYFSEKYIIVPGEKIDASLTGFYYVCFDFERGYTEAEWANEKTMGSYEAWNGNNYQGGWNFSETGHLNEDQVKAAIGQKNGRDIQNIQIKGYLYGDKHCDGDGNYTDWIVRISPAETISEDTPPVTPPSDPSDYQGRIMAEDLNAGEKSDFDFNDVVFDWKIKDNVATIQLLAAGGTLPLTVGGVEVHDKFNVSRNTMVNTGVNSADLPEPYTYEFPEGVAAEANNIPVVVTKGGVPATLTAERGRVASKINVSTTTKWVKEYKDISRAYPSFDAWVSDPSIDWESNFNTDFLY